MRSVCLSSLPLERYSLGIGETTWEIMAVQNQVVLADRLEEFEQFPFGLMLWESAVALAKWIATHAGLVENSRLLELGAGAGLPGLVASRVGAKVFQTDHLAEALLLAQANAERNHTGGITRFLADWREWRCEERFEHVIGADILYDRHFHADLEAIFRCSLAPGGLVVLADPGRDAALEMMAYLERRGWRIDWETYEVGAIRPEESDLRRSVEVNIWKVSR